MPSRNIVATATALKAHGVTFNVYPGFGQDELGIWQAPGGPGVADAHAAARVAWFKDPDGNVLSVTQV